MAKKIRKAFRQQKFLDLALKYKEEKIMTIKEMAKYKKYIPYIKYSMTEKYHELIKFEDGDINEPKR